MASYNIVLIGSAGSGKSCLTIRFIAQRFVPEYDPTLEDSYRKTIEVDSHFCTCDIYDTAGTEDFKMVRDSYVREAEGFLCVFALDNLDSFREVIRLHDHVARVKDFSFDKTFPFVVAGNKADLDESEKIVSRDEVEKVLQIINVKSYFETSALTDYNVKNAFTQLVREIRDARMACESCEHGGTKKLTKKNIEGVSALFPQEKRQSVSLCNHRVNFKTKIMALVESLFSQLSWVFHRNRVRWLQQYRSSHRRLGAPFRRVDTFAPNIRNVDVQQIR